jgi:hypothetical protein
MEDMIVLHLIRMDHAENLMDALPHKEITMITMIDVPQQAEIMEVHSHTVAAALEDMIGDLQSKCYTCS